MGNVQHKGRADGLTKFQRKKLKYEFNTFFDLNKDGIVTYNDFLWAKDKICFMSGWKIDSPKYQITEALFTEIWESLAHIADIDKDGQISKAEWLAMWSVYKKEIMAQEKKDHDFLAHYYKQSKEKHEKKDKEAEDLANGRLEMEMAASNQESMDWPVELDSDEEAPPQRPKEELLLDEKGEVVGKKEKGDTVLEQFASHATKVDDSRLPHWLYKYLVYRFNLLDRCGDNVIDKEEFEYVLTEFGVSPRDARQAFTMFTQNDTVKLDFDNFVRLFEEYYLSDDPGALGNFINGKLTYDEEESEDEDPGALSKTDRRESTTSVHSMDEDLRGEDGRPRTKAMMDADKEKSKSSIRLHDMAKKMKTSMDSTCCVLL